MINGRALSGECYGVEVVWCVSYDLILSCGLGELSFRSGDGAVLCRCKHVGRKWQNNQLWVFCSWCFCLFLDSWDLAALEKLRQVGDQSFRLSSCIIKDGDLATKY